MQTLLKMRLQKRGSITRTRRTCELCGTGDQCRWKNMIDYDSELWDRVMNINVKGTWLISKACVPHLKQSAAGKIINVASDTALWGAPNLMAYVASKGAIVAMTRSMARELGQFNICVNTLSPG